MSNGNGEWNKRRATGRGGGQQAGLPAGILLGRIAGVPVRMHWSVLIIMALVAWALAGAVFPTAYPDQPRWQYVAAGLAAAVAFFLGLLAHEVSHVVVAQRNGVPVESITLWLFGGVAQLRGEAKTPGAELRIAGVGPLVSLLLGIAFGAGAAGAALAAAPPLLVAALSWLGGINVLLAVFNILPGAPLDGGRVLRAALWKWRGDRHWATVMAARVGRGLGMVLIGAGLVYFLLDASLGALWLALIGWFILGAATAEERGTRMTAALAGVRVADVMTPTPSTAPPDISVALFIDRYLFGQRHSTFPLTVDGAPIGLATLSRVRAVPPEKRPWTTLREIASPVSEVPLAAPDDDVLELLPRMNGAADRRALVVSAGQLVGIVSPVDIARALERSALRTTAAACPP